MPNRIARTRSRARLRGALLAAAVVTLLGVAPREAWAGPGEESVAGRWSRITGVTRQRASFGEPVRSADFLEVAFGQETFSARAVSGDYSQNGRKLRFEIDPERLRNYELSWEHAFLAHLEAEGLAPDSVACQVDRARLKGKLRGGEVKLTSSYRFQCLASGDFGEIEATARKRFRGRGPINDGLFVPLPGIIFNRVGPPYYPGQGSGGATFQIAPVPPLPGFEGPAGSLIEARGGSAGFEAIQLPALLIEIREEDLRPRF